MNKNQFCTACLALISLGLIGTGAWMIYPPLSFLAVGGLLWYDLVRAHSDDKPGRSGP